MSFAPNYSRMTSGQLISCYHMAYFEFGPNVGGLESVDQGLSQLPRRKILEMYHKMADQVHDYEETFGDNSLLRKMQDHFEVWILN